MTAKQFFSKVVSLIIVGVCVKSDQVTFQNVSIWTVRLPILPFGQLVTTINSSDNLKEHLAKYELDSVIITGKIPILYEDSVADIHNVHHIHFVSNEIAEIRLGAFRNLPNMTSLMLTQNNLTTLKRGSFDNLPLEVLQVSNNPELDSLEEGVFDHLIKLQMLDLSHNALTILPVSVFKNLPHLKIASLDSNKLTQIRKEIFDNPSIYHLDLSNNLISNIDKDWQENLPNLGTIILTGNRLTCIPEGVFNNHNLKRVELSNNEISYIAPGAFDNMPNLAKIYFTSNKLSEYDTRWFHNTPNIYKLFLDDNRLQEIPDEAFKNIYNHKEQWIKLGSNEITTITPKSFKGFKRINSLDLSNNKIQVWQDKFLEDAETVDYLNLTHNQILCPDGNFDRIFKADITYLAGNPLEADCEKRIKDWLVHHRKGVKLHE